MKMFRIVVNDNEYRVGIEELQEDGGAAPVSTPRPAAPQQAAAAPRPTAPAAAAPKPSAAPAAGAITAAMPGTILDIRVGVGDAVTHGQTLLILEAMKMENEIMAPGDGVVKEIVVAKGASVNAGDVLIVL